MDELKPCPFCGGGAVLEVFDGRYGPFLYTTCELCGASSKRFLVVNGDDIWEGKAARQAVYFWNKREGG